MPVSIPCRTDLPHYSMQIALDGATYTLEFRWNTREGSWYLDIRAEDNSPIAVGLKVVPGVALGSRSADSRLPPGMLVAVDTTRKGTPPAINELGDRVQLIYLTAAEAEAA